MPDMITQFLDDVRWLEAENEGGDDAPVFGLVRVTGADALGRLTVDRPDGDGQQVLIVGERGIAADAVGRVTDATVMVAAYDDGDGTPAVGETWGAGEDSYLLRKDMAGFVILGGASGGRVLVARAASGGSSPNFSGAKVNLDSGNFSVATGTAGLIVNNWELIYDEGGCFDGGDPDQLTAPEDGFYAVGATLIWSWSPNSPAAAGRIQSFLSLSTGAEIIARCIATGADFAALAAATNPVMNFSGICRMDAGDFVRVTAFQNSGTDMIVAIGSEFWLHRIR